MPNDTYQDSKIRAAARSIGREGLSGKFCISSGVGLDLHTEVINKTTTKKELLQHPDLSCFDVYNQLYISC